MPTYELIFHTDVVPEDVVGNLIDDFDAVITTDHDGQHTVGLAMSGTDCHDAAMTTISELTRRGVVVQRMLEDLVTRSDIADRLDVTRQAVGLWVRGQRKAGFPATVNPVAGGVWLWGDVVRWAQNALNYDAWGAAFPTLADHDSVNAGMGKGTPLAWGDVAAAALHNRHMVLAWSAQARKSPPIGARDFEDTRSRYALAR